MMLDAIVHDPSRYAMAAPIDQRFFGREHLRKVWPITVIVDDHKPFSATVAAARRAIVGHITMRELLVRPHPDDVRR